MGERGGVGWWQGWAGGVRSNRRWCGLQVEWSAMGIVADGGGKGRGGRGVRGRGREVITCGSAPVQATSQNMRCLHLCFCTFGTIDLKKQRRRVMPQKRSTEERVKPQKRKINKKIMPEQGRVEKRVKPLKHSKNERILLKNNMEEKEQMMAAKLYENAKLITDILKGNLGESSDCLLADLKNVKDSQTDFTRRQGDRLITCLGNLADTLDQLCDIV
ncbi:hypothetical protein ACSBR1_022435 [Camellia fascicularis]